MTDKFSAKDRLKRINWLCHGLTLYTDIARSKPVELLLQLLEEVNAAIADTQQIWVKYHNFLRSTIDCNWPNNIVEGILQDNNLFSRQGALSGNEGIESGVYSLAARDLDILQEIASVSAGEVKQVVADIFYGHASDFPAMLEGSLNPLEWPEWGTQYSGVLAAAQSEDDHLTAAGWLQALRTGIKLKLVSARPWSTVVDELAFFYKKVGYGPLSKFTAFRCQSASSGDNLCGISNPDPIGLHNLFGLQRELQVILENTEHFLRNSPANNLILYGNRGTGKSSVIKALLNTYVERGLRLVELPKYSLANFTQLVHRLKVLPQKFIIFIDDLSFEETGSDYATLKSLLEGTLEAKPANVLVYATSNRRHLVKETFADRQEDDLHARDGMEEKLSLADRFGITVTFTTPDQEEYLRIVEGLCAERNLAVDSSELRRLALRWEMQHNGRSGRTARQFVDYLTARCNCS